MFPAKNRFSKEYSLSCFYRYRLGVFFVHLFCFFPYFFFLSFFLSLITVDFVVTS